MAEDFMAMYKQALERLSTGGMSLEASLQEIEEGKTQAIAGGQQALVSGGLAGTTVMGGVPIQAEKIAARQRLGARGRAEEQYLTTLASFAAFAQRGEEAKSEREAAMERLQAQITGQQEAAAIGAQPALSEIARRRAAGLASGGGPGPFGGTGGGGGYADQFPSIYDQQETLSEQTPDWMGEVDRLKLERGPGGVYALGDRTTYTGEQAAWLREQSKKIGAARAQTGTFANPMAVYGAPGVEGEGGLGAVSDPTSPVSRYISGGYGGAF